MRKLAARSRAALTAPDQRGGRGAPSTSGCDVRPSGRDMLPLCGVFPTSSTVRKRDEAAHHILEARLRCTKMAFGGSVAILEYPLLPRVDLRLDIAITPAFEDDEAVVRRSKIRYLRSNALR